jgi:hypothetical protein
MFKNKIFISKERATQKNNLTEHFDYSEMDI